MKIRPVRAEMFRAGGLTDVSKPVVAFRSFAKAPKSLSASQSLPHEPQLSQTHSAEQMEIPDTFFMDLKLSMTV
jgi:hypothetical protein